MHCNMKKHAVECAACCKMKSEWKESVVAWFADKPDMYLDEVVARVERQWDVRVSVSTVWRFLSNQCYFFSQTRVASADRIEYNRA